MEAEGMVWIEHIERDGVEKTEWRLHVENSVELYVLEAAVEGSAAEEFSCGSGLCHSLR